MRHHQSPCEPPGRPAGVHWVPSDQVDRIIRERETNPCAVERFPFESMETLSDPAKHAEFVRTRLHQTAPRPACSCGRGRGR